MNLKNDIGIIPQPAKILINSGFFPLKKSIDAFFIPLIAETLIAFGVKPGKGFEIKLNINSELPDEGFRLNPNCCDKLLWSRNQFFY